MDDVSRAKSEIDDKNLRLSREKADLLTNLQENEEELQVNVYCDILNSITIIDIHHTYTHTHPYSTTNIHKLIHKHIHIGTHTHAPTHTHTHRYEHIYTDTHSHKHTHT